MIRIGLMSVALFALLLPMAGGMADASVRSSCDRIASFHQVVESELGETRKLQSSYGIALVHRSSGRILCEDFHAPDRIVYPASSIKTLVAVAVLRRIDQGQNTLEDVLTITQPNADAECKYWGCRSYGLGGQVSIKTLLKDMITISNNIATNQLIELVSKEFINETADRMDASSLRVNRRLYQDVNPDPEIPQRNTASARGMVQMYREISTGYLGILSDRSRRHLIHQLLGKQKYNNRLNYHFPADLKFYHKTGSTSFSMSDAGFFHLDSEIDVMLVGLQDFRDSGPLRRIGKRGLDLVHGAP